MTVKPEQLFSANFSCPHCGYSISELEPRIFSFNSPAGACETCDGLGIEQYFDEKRIVTNPELSLADGAIDGWSSKSNYYFQMLFAVAEHYGFSLTTPFKSLTKKQQQYVLNGTGTERISLITVMTKAIWCRVYMLLKG